MTYNPSSNIPFTLVGVQNMIWPLFLQKKKYNSMKESRRLHWLKTAKADQKGPNSVLGVSKTIKTRPVMYLKNHIWMYWKYSIVSIILTTVVFNVDLGKGAFFVQLQR